MSDNDTSHQDRRVPQEEFNDWYAAMMPDKDEIEDWALRERKRRQEWMAGPTEAEKKIWAKRKRAERVRRAVLNGEAPPSYGSEGAPYACGPRNAAGPSAYRREADLAMKGFWYMFWNWPTQKWAELVRAGSAWEEEAYSGRGPTRIRYEYEQELD